MELRYFDWLEDRDLTDEYARELEEALESEPVDVMTRDLPIRNKQA